MIDFVLVPNGLPVRECLQVGRMPVRTDHRLVVVEVSLAGGGGGGGTPGTAWGSSKAGPRSPPAGAGTSMGEFC